MGETTPLELAAEPEDSPKGSDEEVEVTFPHSQSQPFRRKSSLVLTSSTRPRRSNECIVHQFFESQRRAANATAAYDQQSGERLSTLREPELESEPRPSDVEDGRERHTDLPLGLVELQDGATADTNSRLLTKKQLGEMAWGVRELGRRLGNMRLRFNVRNIFLLAKLQDRDIVIKARELTRWLLDERGRGVRYTIYIEASLRQHPLFDADGLLCELRVDPQVNNPSEHYLQQRHLHPEQQKQELQLKDDGKSTLGRRLRTWDDDMCRTRPHTFDLVITLGGDGTVLYASWLFQRIVPPVLSFSLGSLGFLTKFDFETHWKVLTTAFSVGVTVSLRLRFEGTVMRSSLRSPQSDRIESASALHDSASIGRQGQEHDRSLDPQRHTDAPYRDLIDELVGEEKADERTHWPDGTYTILNEIVVDRGPNPTLSSLELFTDDEHLTSMSADGVCVSTPTGSTAYNLAAGGSLCHPENPVMLVTAICAHTLSSRPIVLPDTVVLRVGVPYNARTNSWASFDGQDRVQLDPGDYITISASRYPFAAVRASPDGTLRLSGNDDWVASISKKLGWNTREQQKAFK